LPITRKYDILRNIRNLISPMELGLKKYRLLPSLILITVLVAACNSNGGQTTNDGSVASQSPSSNRSVSTEDPVITDQGSGPAQEVSATVQDGMQVSGQYNTQGNCPMFFTETWDGSTTGCWSFADAFVVTTTNQDQIHMTITDSGALRMRINTDETYLYLPYSQSYSGVSITADVTSNEVNAHEASLFCGFNDNGFFEVRFNTAGNFAVYQFDTVAYMQGGNPYSDYIQRNSTYLRTGNGRTNTVQIVCDQSTFTVNINGYQVFTRNFPGAVINGGVGIGAISHDNYPVDLVFDNIVIAEP
jgi:hypothetical protein